MISQKKTWTERFLKLWKITKTSTSPKKELTENSLLPDLIFCSTKTEEKNELSEDMNYELSKAIEITALGLSAGALPKEPGGEEAEKVEDLVIGFESRPEEDKQEELEFIAAVGAYWGECLIRRFEGKWTEHDEDGV